MPSDSTSNLPDLPDRFPTTVLSQLRFRLIFGVDNELKRAGVMMDKMNRLSQPSSSS